MKLGYKRLGDYIQLVDERNRNLEVETLLGLSMRKEFRKSTSNVVGTNMANYKIVRKDRFACDFMSVIRVFKLPVVLQTKDEAILVSPAYSVFEVIDKNVLVPEYLMLWFRRSEFDRYCFFKCDSAVRGGFNWTELCETEVKIPSLEKQKELIAEYEAVENRIQLNKKLCATLEETAQTIYKHWFEDFEFPVSRHCEEEGTTDEAIPSIGYKSSGGEMVECEELGKEIPKGWKLDFLKNISKIKGGKRLPKDTELNNNHLGNPYVKVADMCNYKYLILDEKIQYVESSIQKIIKNYIVKENDLIISIVGTIGLINIVDKSLEGANLTENCFKITDLQNISFNYLYAYLNSYRGRQKVIEKTVGAVQAKLPMYNVESLLVLLPKKTVAEEFNFSVSKINKKTLLLQKQTQKLEELKSLLLGKMAVQV